MRSIFSTVSSKAKALGKATASGWRTASGSPYTREILKGGANALGAITAISLISIGGSAVQRHNAQKRYNALPGYKRLFSRRPH
jgi:hypothetical protein